MPHAGADPFWRTKRLNEMTTTEWEALCDGCGRCCLHKLRDEATDELAFTNISCHLLDLESCRCGDYANRVQKVPDCTTLTPALLGEIDWLPPSCAYRLLTDGQDLPEWHPLITGDPSSTCREGASVTGRSISETEAGPLEHHIVRWPAEWPYGRRR